MVRLKNRYLLLEILYPSTIPGPSPGPTATTTATPTDPHHKQATHLKFHAPTPDTLTPGILAKAIRDEVADLFGDWGVGRLGGGGASVKYLSPATSTAILRVPRASFRLVWAALMYISALPVSGPASGSGGIDGRRECVFRVVRVSGTMRKAEEEAIRRARREIVRVGGVEEGSVLGGLVGMDEEEEEEEEEDVEMDG